MRKHTVPALVLLVLLLLVALAAVPQVVEAQGAMLSPDTRSLDLVRGTKGEHLPVITYKGSYTLGTTTWTHCTASVTLAGPMSGIQPVLVSNPACIKLSDRSFEVVVQVKFIGVYTGGTFSYNPITSARAIIYNGTDVLNTITFSIEQITISEVVVTSVVPTQTPVSPGSIMYKVFPPNLTIGSTIYIVPVGDVNLVLTLDRAPTVPPSFNFRVFALSTTGSSTASTRIDFAPGETSKEFTLAGVALESSMQFDVFHNDIHVYSGTIELSSAVDLSGYGKAVLTTEPPSLVWKQETYYAYGAATVLELKSASLTIQFSANNNNAKPANVNSPGRVSFEVPLSSDRPSVLQGEYVIMFSPQSGGTVTVTVSFRLSYMFTSGKFLSYVFFTLFNSLLGISLFIFFFGFFMRRVDLMGYGMLTLIFAALIFGVPTIMSYAVRAAVAAGIEDPVGLQDITILNLGEKLDRALEYVTQKAMYFSNVMFGAATALVIVLGVLAGIVIGGGIAGIFTGGALSIFLGQTLGAFASHLVGIIVMLYLGSLVLSALSAVFPIFLNVIITLLIFMALLHAAFAIITNNLTPLVNTVISLSFVIMLVFLAPLVMATLDRLYYEQFVWIGIGPVGFRFPLNPLLALAIAVIEIIFLVMVLAMAFHRLMAVMHGFGTLA